MKIKTKAIPISPAMLAELHKHSPGEGEIDMDKLPPALRKKLIDMAEQAIADDAEGCGTCPGCDAELQSEYEAKVPGFVRDMVETMIKAKNYAPEKHKEAMRDAMQKAIAHAGEIDNGTDDQSNLVAELQGLAKALHERIKDQPADEVVKGLRSGDTPMATLINALEQRVKARPELLRDPDFQASVKHQLRGAMLDTIMAEIKGKAKAKPEPDYEPQYEMIVEHVILKKTKGEKLERVYQRFVKVTDDDSVSNRAFQELEAAMLEIAPDDAWSIIDTGDDAVSAIGCKVDGAKYQAKQIGHKLRVG